MVCHTRQCPRAIASRRGPESFRERGLDAHPSRLSGGGRVSGAIFSFNRPADRFVIVANDLVEDAELKHAAFRIVVYVGRHADTFRLSQESIGKALGMDRGTVARHLRHLEELGYLARARNFTATGRQADDLYVSQVRLTPEEWNAALQSQCCKTPQCKTPRGETQQRKKTNSKKTNKQEDQLSEGSTAGAAPADEVEAMEDDVKAKIDEPALFEVESPPKPPAAPSSKDVTAAYVDSFRETHEREPLRRDIGRVARETKALLDDGQATVAELISAARAMGRGVYANIGMQLKISRGRGTTPAKVAASLPIMDGDPRWDELAASTAQKAASLMEQFDGSWGQEVLA